MSKPERFQLTTDFATLKNDAKGQVDLIIPTGVAWAAGATQVFEAFIDLGTQNAAMRVQMRSTRYGDNWCQGTSLQSQVTFNVNGSVYDDYIVANVERVSATRIRLYCLIPNFSPYTMTIVGGGQTITASINTFLSPFQ